MAAKCPNCGEKVARTKDWACQLCAYPLMSGSFKMIPMTYTQLKEEERAARLPSLPEEPVAVIEPEAEPELEPEPELESVPELEPEPERQPAPVVPPRDEEMIDPESELALEAEAEPEPETAPEPQAKPKAKAKSRAKTRAESETKTKKPKRVTKRKPAAEAEPASEPETISEPEPAGAPEDEVGWERDSEPGQVERELTAEEMLAAYEANGTEADAEFSGKILKVTGLVSRVEVREMMDIQYIALASAEKERMQTIRCTFTKKHASELNALTLGEAVSVIGQYDGSLIDISLRNCILV